MAEALDMLADHVVGTAPAHHVPTEVAAHRRLADGRLGLQQSIDAVLGVGHVVPERVVYILGPVKIDYVIRPGGVDDLSQPPGGFVLDVRILIEPDEPHPIVHIQQPGGLTGRMGRGRGL